ncbi:MAG: hypothetical protein LBH06_09660 [Rikenellaceae bacterium]|jgi:multisubunit Na+/H+ antiporter MnhG subunit|nr:hypothetical protein [Rikenellaceae bacterium]
MKRWILSVSGALLSLVGAVQLAGLAGNFDRLTAMGKGYVAGSLILLIAGVILIIMGARAGKRNK